MKYVREFINDWRASVLLAISAKREKAQQKRAVFGLHSFCRVYGNNNNLYAIIEKSINSQDDFLKIGGD